MKTCFKCNVQKPLIEFYKHKGMADGFLNKCKSCTREDVIDNRNKNIEKYREYDRERAKNSERQQARIEINRAWRNEDKRRAKCHNAVARAIKSGELVRIPCVRCGDVNSLAHHEDYDKPLEVIWFCQPCHKERHKEINQYF
jgi:hypothetical protein